MYLNVFSYAATYRNESNATTTHQYNNKHLQISNVHADVTSLLQ